MFYNKTIYFSETNEIYFNYYENAFEITSLYFYIQFTKLINLR